MTVCAECLAEIDDDGIEWVIPPEEIICNACGSDEYY